MSTRATCAMYPGSFDPITHGHQDIIARAAQLFEQLIVAVVTNPNKKPTLPVAKRIELIEASVAHLPNVSVKPFDGLTIEFAKASGAQVLVRGLRAVSDFEYEFKMSQMNKSLDGTIETIFMMAGLEYQFLSSSVVKEVARYGGSIEKAVTPEVADALKAHYAMAGTLP